MSAPIPATPLASAAAPAAVRGAGFWKSSWPTVALVLGDAVGFLLSWIGAYLLRQAMNPFLGPINSLEPYLEPKVLLTISVLGILNAWAFRLYFVRRRLSSLNAWNALLKASYHYLLYLAVMGYFFKHLDLGRSVILLAGVMGFVWLYGSRSAFRAWKQSSLRAGRGRIRALIVGTGPLAREVRETLRHHRDIGFDVVGFVRHPQDPADASAPEGPILGSAEQLAELVRDRAVEEIFLAVPHLSPDEQLDLADRVRARGVRTQVVSDLFGVITAQAKVDEIARFPVVELRDGQLPWHQAFLKRAFDLAVGVLGVAVWLLFFHWWIAIWIRRDSPGPVFFKQTRIGRKGNPFTIWKYRTMRIDTDPYAVAPTDAADPRVTGPGVWLRKTSLDELPQLWNVLRGDMSMVGPRPEMPFLVDQYEGWQRRRLDVKPGLTGLWQVIGRKNLPLHMNMEYDFYYIMNQSLLLDFEILLRTLPAVVKGRGAF